MYKTMGKKVGVMTVHKNNTYDADLVNYIGNKNEMIAKNLFSFEFYRKLRSLCHIYFAVFYLYNCD